MAIVRINPKSKEWPYLKVGGKYGPGAEHSAEVTVTEFVPQVEVGDGPGFDRDCEKADYCFFNFQVKSQEFGLSFVRTHQPIDESSGSKALEFISNLGIHVDEDGNFDDTGIVGTKCVVEVKEPRQGKDGKWWNGDVVGVYGA